MTESGRASLLSRIARFGIVGAINTGVHYGTYLLVLPVLPYLLANVVAALVAMSVSYLLNCYFTFRIRPTLRKFLLFPLSNATNFIVQTTSLYLLVDMFGMSKVIAPLPAAAAAIPITFIATQAILVGSSAKKEPAKTPEPATAAD